MEGEPPNAPLKKGVSFVWLLVGNLDRGVCCSVLQKLTQSLVLVTLISAFGSSFQNGYNVRVLNNPAVLIKYFYNATYFQRTHMNIDENLLHFLWDFMLAFFPVGGLIGSLLMGPLADNYGRKRTLLATSILSVISAVLICVSKVSHTYELMFIGRLVVGFCAGISSSVVPMYLAEMAPTNLRGAIVMVAYLFFTFGAVMAHVFGLHQLLGTYTGWPVLLGLTGIPALLQIMLLPSFPESPRYLLIQEKNEMAARRALETLRGRDDVEDEMEEIRQEDVAEAAEKSMNIFKLLRFKALRWHVLSVVVLILGQQLSGVNVLPICLKKIYLSAELEESHFQYFILLVNMADVLVSLGMIFVVDSWGRKCLLLSGFGICSFSCVFLTMTLDLQSNIPWTSFLSIAFAIIFLFGHTIGPAPIPSLVTAELFLQSSRSTAFVIGGFLHWLGNFFTVLVFLHIQEEPWSYTFLIFFPFCAYTFYYIFKVIPETKNKTFVEIRASLANMKTAEQTV